MEWEKKSSEEIFKEINSSETGLTSNEASYRLNKKGKNTLKEKEKTSHIIKFLQQFTEPLMILLIIAGLIAGLIGDYIDSGVIFFVVILNAIMGYRQENKAEDAMEKLKSMSTKTAIILRDNQKQEINVEEITIGDIVILEEGDHVPADLRLIETYDLKVDESSLTGESIAVTKTDEIITGIEESESYSNMCYMNTSISRGHAKGIVIAIGMNTEIGKIATLIQENEEENTPLQEKISKLGQTLGFLAVIVCIIIFILQLFQGIPASKTFMTAVSLAVAAIPEGLPAILTLTLALGMQKMAKNHAIVRKLLAVETLGSCSVICTDKTGTLTLNKLKVTDEYVTNVEMAYLISGYCNNAKIDIKKQKTIGDPTDVAILEYALKNQNKQYTEKNRLFEIPLDSSRKRMTTINKLNDAEYAFIKGAPEVLLEKCDYINKKGKISKITIEDKKRIQDKINEFTTKALRVIALTYKKIDNYTSYSTEELESNFIFVGLVGMIDPPRDEVFNAIETCKNAGISVKMITGDHPDTAKAIAKKVGINNTELILTGSEINKISEKEFAKRVQEINVFARVFPEQKVKIVKALKNNDEIVSMTGDGVNDAPALTTAHIGVSMGSGTDVAKESSDMILQNDNFATIISSIKEGRTIFANIKRFIKYQLSTNIAAILTIFVSTLLSIPLPFNPVQLLWINIIMDGPPAQSLGVELSDKNIMKNPPLNENILSKDNLIHIALIGIVMAVGTLGLYLYELSIGTPTLLASTIAFTVFVMYQLFNVFNCKAKSGKINKTLIIAVTLSLVLQLLAIYTPLLQSIFRTTAIPIGTWIPIIIISCTIVIAEKIIVLIEKKIKNN